MSGRNASIYMLDRVTNMITNTTNAIPRQTTAALRSGKCTFLFEAGTVTAAATLTVQPVWNVGGGGGNLAVCSTVAIGATGIIVLPLNAALINATGGGAIPFPTHVLYTLTANKTCSGTLFVSVAD